MAEPFGLAASFLPSGGLRDKWLGVQRRLDDEMVQLALCEGDRDGCVSPATLARGGGDCEDYAIAKFIALRRAGLAPDDLRIVVLHDTIHGEDHAVAAARLDGRWLMLDNRRMAMVEDSDIRNYRPTFVIDQHGVMKYADAPLLADALGNHSVASFVVSSLAGSTARPFERAD